MSQFCDHIQLGAWAHPLEYCQEQNACRAVLVIHHVLVMLLSQRCSPLVYVRFNTLPPLYTLGYMLAMKSQDLVMNKLFLEANPQKDSMDTTAEYTCS